MPPGLSVDTITGFITGVPLEAGTFDVTLGAYYAKGSDFQPLRLTIYPAFPTISLVVTRPFTVAGGDSKPAKIKVVRTGDLSGRLVVFYDLGGDAKSGQDYQPLPGFVVLLPGSTSAIIEIAPTDRVGTATPKRLKLTLRANSDYYQLGEANKGKIKILPTEL